VGLCIPLSLPVNTSLKAFCGNEELLEASISVESVSCSSQNLFVFSLVTKKNESRLMRSPRCFCVCG
jgi:hypothetical protein